MQPDLEQHSSARPFLKWPGGKRWLVRKHPFVLPTDYNRYFEPFVGSGAIYFYLAPGEAVLSDINADVVEAFFAIKEDPLGVEEVLEQHSDLHCAAYYYAIRSSSPRGMVNRAARMIYLNRTCFNGVYRLNQSGLFNVPKGVRDDVIFDDDDFMRASEVLQGAELSRGDFESAIDKAQRFDFVFADPPYTVRHNINGFIKYNERLFSWDDQIRLADCLARALNRGVKILCTNADHESVRKLYSSRGFVLEQVTRFSGISADPRKRNAFAELLIKSTNLHDTALIKRP